MVPNFLGHPVRMICNYAPYEQSQLDLRIKTIISGLGFGFDVQSSKFLPYSVVTSNMARIFDVC